MVTQLELFDSRLLGAVPARHQTLPHKWFFLLRPPEADVVAHCARQQSRLHHPTKLIVANNLHISVHFAGDASAPDDRIAAIARAAGGMVRHDCFDVAFDRVQTFSGNGPYPIVLTCGQGAEDIILLRDRIGAALEQCGVPRDPHQLTPHLTLWYDKKRIPSYDLPQPFIWTVHHLCLVHSIHGRGRHELVEQWPLSSRV